MRESFEACGLSSSRLSVVDARSRESCRAFCRGLFDVIAQSRKKVKKEMEEMSSRIVNQLTCCWGYCLASLNCESRDFRWSMLGVERDKCRALLRSL